MSLKITHVKDMNFGRTCGKEAGEAAFGDDMFCVTSVSSEAYLCVLYLVLHLSIRCISEDMECCVKVCVIRKHSSWEFFLWGNQRDLGAGEPGDAVRAFFPGGVLRDSCI